MSPQSKLIPEKRKTPRSRAREVFLETPACVCRKVSLKEEYKLCLESQELSKGVISRQVNLPTRARFHVTEEVMSDVRYLAKRLHTKPAKVWRLVSKVGLDTLLAIDKEWPLGRLSEGHGKGGLE